MDARIKSGHDDSWTCAATSRSAVPNSSRLFGLIARALRGPGGARRRGSRSLHRQKHRRVRQEIERLGLEADAVQLAPQLDHLDLVLARAVIDDHQRARREMRREHRQRREAGQRLHLAGRPVDEEQDRSSRVSVSSSGPRSYHWKVRPFSARSASGASTSSTRSDNSACSSSAARLLRRARRRARSR